MDRSLMCRETGTLMLRSFHMNVLYAYSVANKLAKLGDAIAISKSETVTHSLTHRPFD